MAPSVFLERHWHKQPLLVRAAIPEFANLLSLRELITLAAHDACESRLVVGKPGKHEVVHGPIPRRVFRDLPVNHWTLLVQGVNHVLPAARQLLSRFSFLPHARLDDLMVSYAAPGGGVGAHADSYDVFLLQGSGKRSWEVSTQPDLELRADSELKLLKRFRPAGSCVVAAGDMLYLPPHCAHNGVALGACFTYSIGFTAPAYQELKSQFLAYLDDRIRIDGRYGDAGLTVPAHAGEISGNMITDIARALSRISWNRSTVTDFVGRYLSEPKWNVVMRPPPELGYKKFLRRAQREGVELHPALRLLFRGSRAFLNGEAFPLGREVRNAVVALADRRRLSGAEVRNAHRATRILYEWYGNGYLNFGDWGQS